MTHHNTKTNTFDISGMSLRLMHLGFGKNRDSHMKASSFYFQKLKAELKNLISTKSYGSLKIVRTKL